MKLIILGPQGSGKGTQSKLLSKHLNIPHISTGDVFREEFKNKTKLGIIANEYTKKGILVPNEIVNDIIKKRIQKKDCKKGFILDGYPRNPEQSELLNSITKIDKVIYLELKEKEIFKRILERQICPKCNAIYGVNFKPKKTNRCNKCNSKLIKREDDLTKEQIKSRLKSYEERTKPLLGIYKDKIIKADASKSVEIIFKNILKKL
ncbi:MAG: nucleoside monophosphate kinase [Nanoarchaeota archaeon]